MAETSSSSTTCASIADLGVREVIRLCLYGEVEKARLQIEPDTLCFGDVIVGQMSQRVLRFTNPSTVAPIYLEYLPNANARCCPNQIKLTPQSPIEVLIKVHAKESSNYYIFNNSL